ncbi:hypothetical protein T4A_13927 [Trichinella pseudospiralis]|uniref:Uncharacterized protein n=1 Tax=Trichinella pseudospiralis TaxID=6337 RepID=A0A0V1DL44_TRIPS|nr:hypothetical protein T4A_13927 [Trichinella pseudospiralis]
MPYAPENCVRVSSTLAICHDRCHYPSTTAHVIDKALSLHHNQCCYMVDCNFL